jgi:CheY-like chemotaxis protein
MILDTRTTAGTSSPTNAGHNVPQSTTARGTNRSPDGPYILIIDDDADIVDVLVKLLESVGWQAIGMRSGTAAHTFLKHTRLIPSLILLDLMMPDMNGDEFILFQQIDADLKHIPVVIVSAGVNKQALSSRLDIVAFLPKPFDVPQLLNLCESYCPRTLN